jgi:hypothetical protein
MSNKYDNITQEYLKSILDYNENDGNFYWKKSRGTAQKGNIAGNVNIINKYRIIGINKKIYSAHILVWIYFYGQKPNGLIDHINMNKSDNRIVNLREVTAYENRQNTKNPSNNTSGKKGVVWNKAANRFEVRITIQNKRISLGYYADIKDAINARNMAEEKYYKCRSLD